MTNRKRQLVACRTIVAAEASPALSASSAPPLSGALFGIHPAATARDIIGAAVFMAVWAAVLIVGNRFSYWFGYEGRAAHALPQNLFGLGTILPLAI